MEEYQVVFTTQTYPTEQLTQKGIWVISHNLYEYEDDDQEKVDKFDAIINRLKSASVTIDILTTEELNIRNFEIFFLDAEMAKLKTKENFQKWELKNKELIEKIPLQLTKPLTWKELLSHNQYPEALKLVNMLYDSDSEFSGLVTQAQAEKMKYLPKLAKKLKMPFAQIDKQLAFKKFLDYTLEESSIILILRLLGYSGVFYAGKMNASAKYMCSAIFKEHNALGINDKKINFFEIERYVIKKKKKNETLGKLQAPKDTKVNITTPAKARLTGASSEELEIIAKSYFNSPNIASEDKNKMFFKFFSHKMKLPINEQYEITGADDSDKNTMNLPALSVEKNT